MGRQIEPPGYHVIEQGDWISLLARWYGFAKWETIWSDAKNSELREKRRTPNILLPGDEVYVPKLELKAVAVASGQRHRFKLATPPDRFVITLLDDENEPRPDSPYKLTLGNDTIEERTDGQGKIRGSIPPGVTRARLQLDDQVMDVRFGHLDPIEETTGIQQRLKNLGYYLGEVDGIAGPIARLAVEWFQEDYPPLTVDGICGPKTQGKLKEIHGA